MMACLLTITAVHLDLRKAQLIADVLEFIKGRLGSAAQDDQPLSKL